MTHHASPRQQRFRPQTVPGWWVLGLLGLVALTLPLGNLIVVTLDPIVAGSLRAVEIGASVCGMVAAAAVVGWIAIALRRDRSVFVIVATIMTTMLGLFFALAELLLRN